jgi:Cyclic nucleotide-binding domain
MLGVRADEVERVRGLVGASFLLGMALVLFYGSANAVFLTRYDVTALPWVYIANAVAVITIGLSYGAWSATVPVGRALAALAVAMTVSVGLLWLWATLSDDRVVAFLLAMWFRLLFIFAVLGLWEIASAVFDIRQAKRLFASVALGVMLAFVVGGLATPVLGPLIGTVNLVGVAAICFALYTVDFRRLLRRHEIGARQEAGGAAPAGPAEILADRYSRRMVWMKYVTILLLYVTEYVFYEQAAGTFDTEASLAGFLGVFMGAMTIVMVLVTGLVSGRFISRFGIRAATLALPVAMLVAAVVAGLYGSIVAVDTLFFALVCVALATNHVVGNAIGEPAGAVLFQPMAPMRRTRVRLAVDGWMGSVALVFSGVLLLAFNALDLDTVAPYLYLVAGIAVAGVVVAILQYRDYVGALRNVTTLGFADAASDGTFGLGALDVLDVLDPAPLTDGHGADAPATVLATARMTQALAADPLAPVLPGLVLHRDPAVVTMALDAIARSGDRSDVALVEEVIDRPDLPVETRARALATLGVLDRDLAAIRSAAMLDGPTPWVAAGVALADPTLRPLGVEHLRRLATSSAPADRVAACRLIEASPAAVDRDAADLDALLVALLQDQDQDVVAAAIAATRGRVSIAVARELARCSRETRHRRRAIRAMSTGDPEVADLVEDLLPSFPDEAVADLLINVIGPHLDAPVVVQRFLAPGCPSVVRRAAYETLGRTAPGTPVRAQLAADVDLITTVTAAHRDVGPAAGVVRDALSEEFELARASVYAALGAEYDGRRVHDIETLVRAGDDDDRANAIEALDVMLATDHRRSIVALLEPVDVAAAAMSLPDLPPPCAAADCLEALCHDRRLTTWTARVVADRLDRIRLDSTRPDGGSPMDPTIERVLSLRRVDIFSALSYESLVELAGLVQTRSVPAGTVIIRAGAPGDELFAVTEGVVEATTTKGNVARLEAGAAFGELAILDPAPRSATVVAVTPVELIVVSRATVLALADRRPAVMADIARVLARRLREST